MVSQHSYEGMRLGNLRSRTGRRRVGIGFDFGTSNSVAAVFDGSGISAVPLEETGPVMPSATYIDKSFSVETGEQAILSYIESNRGRRVEFRAEVIGEARVSTGRIDTESGLPTAADTEKIYGREVDDAGLPGRLFHGVKRLLGSPRGERIPIFGRPFRLVALVTPILARMNSGVARISRAQRLVSSGPDHGCLGHPVRFESGGAGSDRIALDRISEAYRYAGVARQRACPEPIAAAIAYLHAHAIDYPCRILTVDFGGGTLDLCVVRCAHGSADVEAVHGIPLGGNLIDQTLVRELIFPLLGKGRRWRRTVEGREIETDFPFWKYEELLLNWQVSYLLNQIEYTTPLLEQMRKGRGERERFERLYQLITQNLAFEVFQAVRQAKERLSVSEVARIDIPEIDVDVELERPAFEALIAGPLARFDEAIRTTLAAAGIEAADVDLVLRTGGSALIPAFTRILEHYFPSQVVEHDPFTAVAAGLAVADYFEIGHGLG